MDKNKCLAITVKWNTRHFALIVCLSSANSIAQLEDFEKMENSVLGVRILESARAWSQDVCGINQNEPERIWMMWRYKLLSESLKSILKGFRERWGWIQKTWLSAFGGIRWRIHPEQHGEGKCIKDLREGGLSRFWRIHSKMSGPGLKSKCLLADDFRFPAGFWGWMQMRFLMNAPMEVELIQNLWSLNVIMGKNTTWCPSPIFQGFPCQIQLDFTGLPRVALSRKNKFKIRSCFCVMNYLNLLL